MDGLARPLDERHIFRMTDDTGMFQHTIYNTPDLAKGYTADDNARALIMAVKFYERERLPKYLDLADRYLAFVLYAQTEEGHFRNFMTYGRAFTETKGSEECFGRCFWALAYTLSSDAMPGGIKDACESAARRALPLISSLKCLRGQAYALLGLTRIAGKHERIAFGLADSIAGRYERCAVGGWRWFEDSLTYDNALLPWAMFAAFAKTGCPRFLHIARESLRFFDRNAFRDGYFRPVGCDGWWMKGGASALYDQQPVEASMSVLAHLCAYRVGGDEEALALARQSFAWYAGENSCGHSMISAETGGCFDAITPAGANRNQGAESIVGYLIAALAMDDCESAMRMP